MSVLETHNPFTDPWCRHDNQHQRVCECGWPRFHMQSGYYQLGQELPPDRSLVIAYGWQNCVLPDGTEFERLAILTLLPLGRRIPNEANYETFLLWPDGYRETVHQHPNIVGAVKAYVDELGMEWP